MQAASSPFCEPVNMQEAMMARPVLKWVLGFVLLLVSGGRGRQTRMPGRMRFSRRRGTTSGWSRAE